jgi:ubiquinone/menaquinone biosynthesis C-methylase UbiE
VAVDYSELASSYDRTRSSPEDVRDFWLPAITRMGGASAGGRVLDVGCGTGRLAVPLSETYRVVGIDTSLDMLEIARSKRGRARFLLADAGRIPFIADSFDVALAVMVLHLVRDVRAAVRELARVARRSVIATVDIQTRKRHAIDEAFPSLHVIDEGRFPRIADLEATCREAGLAVEVREARRRIEASTPGFLERVRGKYLSTLALLPPGEFERGLAWLEAELPRRGERYAYEHTVTFVVASR